MIKWPIGNFDDTTTPPVDFLVVGHNTESESSDSFGTVTGGYLDLYGELKSAIVPPLVEGREAPEMRGNTELWQLGSDGSETEVVDTFVDYDDAVTEDVDVQCFLLSSTQVVLPGNRSWSTWMLVLQFTELGNT